jgi:hypothetical protein
VIRKSDFREADGLGMAGVINGVAFRMQAKGGVSVVIGQHKVLSSEIGLGASEVQCKSNATPDSRVRDTITGLRRDECIEGLRMNSFAGSLFSGLCLLAMTVAGAPSDGGVQLSPAQLDRVGQRIWQNECGGTVAGLTSWNKGEDFASLGIGHFIWYPADQRGPFEESFPPLVTFLKSRGVDLPRWAQGPCPWKTKAVFDGDKGGERQKVLRATLSRTVALQTEFIMMRMQRALPKMLAETSRANRGGVAANFAALQATPEGTFCLIDYVNFKGEGTNASERYQGQGWGLLQVLEGMTAPTPAAFAESAKRVLSRRVANSPPARGEQRWLPGWHNRCDGYKRRL